MHPEILVPYPATCLGLDVRLYFETVRFSARETPCVP